MLARPGCNELDQLRRLEPDSPVVEELKLLTRDQKTLIQHQSRLLQQLTACLKAYYPLALSRFSRLNQPLTLAFLTAYPTPESLSRASEEEHTVFLRAHRSPRSSQQASSLLDQARSPQLSASGPTARAKTRPMLALVKQLAALAEEIRSYDQEIHSLFSPILTS